MIRNKRSKLDAIIDEYNESIEKEAYSVESDSQISTMASRSANKIRNTINMVNGFTSIFSDMVSETTGNALRSMTSGYYSHMMPGRFLDKAGKGEVNPESGFWKIDSSDDERVIIMSAYQDALGYDSRRVAKRIYSIMLSKPFNNYTDKQKKYIRQFLMNNPMPLPDSSGKDLNNAMAFNKAAVGTRIAASLASKGEALKKKFKISSLAGFTDPNLIATIYSTPGAYKNSDIIKRKNVHDEYALKSLNTNRAEKEVLGYSLSPIKKVTEKFKKVVADTDTNISNDSTYQNKYYNSGYGYDAADKKTESEVAALSDTLLNQETGLYDSKRADNFKDGMFRGGSTFYGDLNATVLPGLGLSSLINVSVMNGNKAVDVQLTKSQLIAGMKSNSLKLTPQSQKILNNHSIALDHALTKASVDSIDLKPGEVVSFGSYYIDMTAGDKDNLDLHRFNSKMEIFTQEPKAAPSYTVNRPPLNLDHDGMVKQQKELNSINETVKSSKAVSDIDSEVGLDMATKIVPSVEYTKSTQSISNSTKPAVAGSAIYNRNTNPDIFFSPYKVGEVSALSSRDRLASANELRKKVYKDKGYFSSGQGYMPENITSSGEKLYNDIKKVRSASAAIKATAALNSAINGHYGKKINKKLRDTIIQAYGVNAYNSACRTIGNYKEYSRKVQGAIYKNASPGEKLKILRNNLVTRAKTIHARSGYTKSQMDALNASYRKSHEDIIAAALSDYNKKNGTSVDKNNRDFLQLILDQGNSYDAQGRKTAWELKNQDKFKFTSGIDSYLDYRKLKLEELKLDLIKKRKGRFSTSHEKAFGRGDTKMTEREYVEKYLLDGGTLPAYSANSTLQETTKTRTDGLTNTPVVVKDKPLDESINPLEKFVKPEKKVTNPLVEVKKPTDKEASVLFGNRYLGLSKVATAETNIDDASKDVKSVNANATKNASVVPDVNVNVNKAPGVDIGVKAKHSVDRNALAMTSMSSTVNTMDALKAIGDGTLGSNHKELSVRNPLHRMEGVMNNRNNNAGYQAYLNSVGGTARGEMRKLQGAANAGAKYFKKEDAIVSAARNKVLNNSKSLLEFVGEGKL